jgi:hypothetical protein
MKGGGEGRKEGRRKYGRKGVKDFFKGRKGGKERKKGKERREIQMRGGRTEGRNRKKKRDGQKGGRDKRKKERRTFSPRSFSSFIKYPFFIIYKYVWERGRR